MTYIEKKWLRFRIATVLASFAVFFLALMTRAFQLQIISGETLKNLANRQHFKVAEILPERGKIYDRNGVELAVSLMVESVCADPSRIRNPKVVADHLARVLEMNVDDIYRKLTGSGGFSWIARHIPPEKAEMVKALRLDGIYMIKEPKRYYPHGELAAHLLGFVGMDSVGLEGLELKYDKYLRGTPDRLVWVRDAKGRHLYPRVEQSPDGKGETYHLVLTLDSKLQHVVESQLREAVKEKAAKGGHVIVMDPRTGEILAMASEPAFNPNEFRQIPPFIRKNRAVTDSYEPGSVLKPFVVAAALEEKLVREGDRFYCEMGRYTVGNRVVHEAQHKRYGYLNVREIIKYSSNIGAAKIGERLGRERLYKYLSRFGFGSKTGVGLPGESQGLLRHYTYWRKVDTVAVSFGQGIAATPLQLVTALSAIANSGILMRPYVVKEILDSRGRVVETFQPTVVRQVLSYETSRKMRAIMKSVVSDDDGTGKMARIESVSVAGKTGTSQKFDFKKGVYSVDRVWATFMGFFPAEEPKLAIIVVLDEPRRDRWGGLASAPLFQRIGEQILVCWRMDLRDRLVGENGINQWKGNIRLAEALKPYVVVNEDRIDDSGNRVPDFRGLTIKEAFRKARETGVELSIEGSGWAVKQDPLPGAVFGRSRFCKVIFSRGM
ncbi:MAG: penicillin-binding transpeptidase domain-containing protein [Syntrophales bacterium]|nr:penicillin-binding transpeptidase domain-containing protein [Syntrophales bacterium]